MSIEFLPANSTHLCQPADSFIIKSIKDMWTDEWDKEKIRLAVEGGFSDKPGPGKASGKLKTPVNIFFLS